MTFHVVLLGLGHTNAHVVHQWALQPPPNSRLTCVSNHALATYSGMLPGVLAGQYQPPQMQIDLRALCAAAGAELIVAQALGLDAHGRQLLLRDGPPLSFDALSIGIGSTPRRTGVELAVDAPVLSIKPMQTFLDRLKAAVEVRYDATETSEFRLVVVGSGAGGVEIAFCLPRQLERLGVRRVATTLIGGGPDVVPSARPAMRRRIRREFGRRGITLELGRRVVQVDRHGLVADDGAHVAADLVIWATDAVAAPLLHSLKLPTDDRGFLLVRDTLQSIATDHVFAVGDCGTLVNHHLPKAGVYAVRQGPILWENLQRMRLGQPLVEYRPQRDFLQLLNLGDGRAIGQFRGLSFCGRWVWRWKDRIDRRFMRMYQM